METLYNFIMKMLHSNNDFIISFVFLFLFQTRDVHTKSILTSILVVQLR